MSYQVLARKWRPKLFSEVVGQEQVLTILSNALSLGRIHHAYLFSGTRGVGKTTIARLFAKGLNCESGVTATPCGVCDNCLSIEQGRFVDLLEIDAASRTKVEDTREIIDNIQYLPTKGRFKVYLIDEVHMLSRSSFNALLKTLEEPPEHVKFLLATTDPQKLPVTILSRCLHLHLNVLDATLIKNQLAKILHIEQINHEEKALQLLAKAANGSMRDALSLTDQAIALGNGQVETSAVMMMLGTLDQTLPFALVEALYHADGSGLMQHLETAAKQGVEWDNLLVETIALLQQIAFLQIVPTALGDYADAEQRIRYLAQAMPPNDVQLFYQILINGRKELDYAPDKKMAVAMSFLRALAFMPKYFASAGADMTQAKIIDNTPSPEPAAIHTNSSSNDKYVVNPATKFRQEDSVVAAEPSSTRPETGITDSENISDITKSILSARQQLIDGEKTLKKSKQVEPVQSIIPKDKIEQINTKLSLPTIDVAKENGETTSFDSITNEAETAETYQWQFSEHFTANVDNKLDAKSIRSAFEHEKTPELVEKLIQEAIKIDAWSAEIERLALPPLIKQIAINAFLEHIDEQHIILHVRSAYAHLVKNPANVRRLSEALASYRQQIVKIDVVIDDDNTHSTPAEVREVIFQDKCTQARKAVNSDSKVALLCQFFEAKIDDESIRPL